MFVKTKKMMVAVIALMMVLSSALVFAKSSGAIDAEVKEALTLFRERIGSDKLDNAVGVLVFPSIIKGGAGIGAEYGQGALLRGGKTVDYYSSTSASVGFQLGGQKKCIIYLFNTKEAYDKFVNSKGWKAGVDASVAVISIGADANIDTNARSTHPVEAFVLDQKGLMYNLSVEGTKIKKLDK